MTLVLMRIFKTIAVLVIVAVVAIAGIARWKLEVLARSVAARSLAGARTVHTGAVHARAWPPAAVVDDFSVRGAAGDEILHARRVVLPLAPGAWLGRGRAVGVPELEGFVLKLRLPRTSAAVFPAALAADALPDWPEWSATDGRIELRVGDGPASAGMILTEVRAARRAGTIVLEGGLEGAPSRRAHLEGNSKDGRLVATVKLGPLDAHAASAALLENAIIRGGEITFEGAWTLDARRATFRGDADARDMVVEGSANPGPVDARLRAGRGRARVPVLLDADLTRPVDWERALRAALESGAR